MTKLEKDTVIDAILIFHKLAKSEEEFLEAVEQFRNEKVDISHVKAKRDN